MLCVRFVGTVHKAGKWSIASGVKADQQILWMEEAALDRPGLIQSQTTEQYPGALFKMRWVSSSE